MLVFQSSWLIAFRRQLRFPNALLLVPLGVAIAFVANVFRIVALIAIGSRWSPSLAIGGFHSKAGWVLFCAAALALMILSRRRRFFSRAVPSAEELVGTWHPTAAYLAPFLSGIAVQLVAGLFSIEAATIYPIELLAVLIPLLVYRKCYEGFRLSWSWVVAFLGVAAFAVQLMFGLPAHSMASVFNGGADFQSIGVALALAAKIAATIVVVPLAQELAFRGYLLRRLISADFTEVSPGRFSVPSFLISTAAFGALQGNWIAGALAGMLYALAQYWRGRVADAFLAHAITSLLAAVYSVAAGAPWPH
jgi:exosortase E/protease (VPEID-CTERM system)